MFHKCNNKRGFKYNCKNCIKEHTSNVPSDVPSGVPSGVPSCVPSDVPKTQSRASNNNKDVVMIVMDCALRHTVSFDSFIEVIKEFMKYTPLDVVCDVAFKQCRASYPDRYTELIRVFLQAPQPQEDQQEDEHEQKDEHEHEHEEQEEQKPNINILSTSQQYIEQYQNDPNMQQVGDDVESDAVRLS